MDNLLFSCYMIKKISTAVAIVGSILALLLCWIGFSVPDWLFYEDEFKVKKKFGLWIFCIQSQQSPYVYNCKSWRNTSDQVPDFLRTTQVLITLACLFITLSVIVGILSLFLKKGYAKILPLVAGLFCLLTLILVFIGLCVFGNDFTMFVQNLAVKNYNRRYGYWIYVFVIILLLFSTFLYPFSFISRSSSKNNDTLYNQKQVQNNGLNPSLVAGGNQPVNRTMDFVENNSIQMNTNKFNIPPLINKSNYQNNLQANDARSDRFNDSVFPSTQKYNRNFYY